MTEQIQTPPTFFDCKKHFGPFFANVTLADDVTNAMIKMTDKIVNDKKSESHGQSLAGVIDKELKIYKDKSGKFRFRLKAKNGEIICSSQGYTSKSSCKKGAFSLILNAKKIKSFKVFKNKAGKSFFNVVAGNNKVIATSQAYKTENSLKKGIESVRKNATKKNLS